MFQTKVVRKKIHTYFYVKFFFRKSCPLLDNVEKYGSARKSRDDYNYTRQSLRMPDNYGKHTHTYLLYLMLIVFPRQQCLRERA
jgi:hypothetical protein